MAYSEINFPTKKALAEAVKGGQKVAIYNPGFAEAPTDGRVYLEGPHYPKPHKWYATVTMKDGYIVSVK